MPHHMAAVFDQTHVIGLDVYVMFDNVFDFSAREAGNCDGAATLFARVLGGFQDVLGVPAARDRDENVAGLGVVSVCMNMP